MKAIITMHGAVIEMTITLMNNEINFTVLIYKFICFQDIPVYGSSIKKKCVDTCVNET